VSLVVFPFKSEPPSLILGNMAKAAANDAIDEVCAVAAEEGEAEWAVRAGAGEISRAHSKPIGVILQERIGTQRPGKGDAMNTAIARAAERAWERVHFYDADITNFDSSWIDGAEAAADRGYGVVRHRFPRAATDAMITWMITRPALARLFPGTLLPRLDQPLGGEVLLTKPAVETLATTPMVRDRSDWGIDTMLTYATSVMGIGLYEHHVRDGKRHSLYGSLDELREMLVECLDAARSLNGLPGPDPEARHGTDPPSQAPEDLKQVVAYDIEGSKGLLGTVWPDAEASLLDAWPGAAADRLLSDTPDRVFDQLDADLWYQVHGYLLDGFVLGDPVWESLAFRLWLMRVLAYTNKEARLGFDQAMAYLGSTIEHYEAAASPS
jgi:mannosylglycerate synthase